MVEVGSLLKVKGLDLSIIDPSNGEAVGKISLAIYQDGDRETVEKRFQEVLGKIPFNWEYPLGVLEEIQVREDQRRKGFGEIGLKMVEEEFLRFGVRTGLLKVGWSVRENPGEAKAWRTKWYQSAGWLSLPWKWPDPVMMAKPYAFAK